MLDLSDNSIGDKGFKKMIGGLNLFSNLCCLNLENNDLTDKSLDPIKLILRYGSPVQSLNLGRNKLGDYFIEEISNMIMKPDCKLRKLCLKSTGMTAVGADTIICSLISNRHIRSVNLSDNDFFSKTRFSLHDDRYLSLLLKSNDSLQVMNLSNCMLQPFHIRAIAKGLHHNMSLRQLYLNKNPLKREKDAYLKLADEVGRSKLSHLEISKCGLDDTFAARVATSISGEKVTL